MILHTTSGTTGKPQPLLFGPRGREVQNLLLARAYLFQGLRDDDVVHSVYGHGMVNGGHYVRETVTHWTRALFLSAGTGVETRSRTQVELMRDFGATVIVGFGDYIRHLGERRPRDGLVRTRSAGADDLRPPRRGSATRCRAPGAAPRCSTGTASATPASSRAKGPTTPAST